MWWKYDAKIYMRRYSSINSCIKMTVMIHTHWHKEYLLILWIYYKLYHYTGYEALKWILMFYMYFGFITTQKYNPIIYYTGY